jgi:hypothetical protein
VRVQNAPSPEELEEEVVIARAEQEAADKARIAKFAASLRVNDDGWDGHTTRYGRKALEGIVTDVVQTEGGRNNALFKGAARVGGLIASGHVVESLAVDMVTNAGLATGLKMDEVSRTVRGAIAAGKKKPWGPEN